MRLCEHPDFVQAILRASDPFRSRGLRPALGVLGRDRTPRLFFGPEARIMPNRRLRAQRERVPAFK